MLCSCPGLDLLSKYIYLGFYNVVDSYLPALVLHGSGKARTLEKIGRQFSVQKLPFAKIGNPCKTIRINLRKRVSQRGGGGGGGLYIYMQNVGETITYSLSQVKESGVEDCVEYPVDKHGSTLV